MQLQVIQNAWFQLRYFFISVKVESDVDSKTCLNGTSIETEHVHSFWVLRLMCLRFGVAQPLILFPRLSAIAVDLCYSLVLESNAPTITSAAFEKWYSETSLAPRALPPGECIFMGHVIVLYLSYMLAAVDFYLHENGGFSAWYHFQNHKRLIWHICELLQLSHPVLHIHTAWRVSTWTGMRTHRVH